MNCYCRRESNSIQSRDPTTERSGYGAQPTIGFWIRTQQAPADCFLDKCERLLGFTCFGLSCLRAELHRRQPVFSGLDTRLGLLESSGCVLKLAFGLSNNFTPRSLGSFSLRFGKP